MKHLAKIDKPATINADLMTAQEIRAKIQEGYDDIKPSKYKTQKLPLRNLEKAINKNYSPNCIGITIWGFLSNIFIVSKTCKVVK
jgi:hypothetical protein